MKSQIVISKGRGGLRRARPYAFTEHGVSMLSCVLRSDQAIDVSLAIIRAFIKLRHAISSQRDLSRRVERTEGRLDLHDTDIRLLVQDVQDLKKKPAPPIERALDVKGFQK